MSTVTVTATAAVGTNAHGEQIVVTTACRKAIVTRYHGPTNTRGSRVSAKCEGGGRVSLAYAHELNSEQNHAAAAATLAAKLGWCGRMVGGGSPDQTGCVFVFVD